MIDCLKRLSRLHKISIITSIHQPNQDLFHKFDSVYILAKGGVCVYSGVPQNLRQYLKEHCIECNENQIPIEVIIKLSFNGLSDENVMKLIRKNQSKNCIETNNLIPIKAPEGKKFKFVDFWTLVNRFLFSYYWKNSEYLIHVILIQTMVSVFVSQLFSNKISESNGCFSVNSTSTLTCIEEEDIKILLSQNQSLLFQTSTVSAIFMSLIITSIYGKSLAIFRSEYQNGMISIEFFVKLVNIEQVYFNDKTI